MPTPKVIERCDCLHFDITDTLERTMLYVVNYETTNDLCRNVDFGSIECQFSYC
jgi:uncharacterized protein YbbC (DUF1343 family)